jgi:hypothetical protein
MSLKLGNQDVTKVMLGGQEVSAIYKGADELWSLGGSAGGYVDDVFSTHLYTGAGTGNNLKVVTGIDLHKDNSAAEGGGLVWIKGREARSGHALYDTDRGTYTSLDSSETAESAWGALMSFDSDGFSLYGGASDPSTNDKDKAYASWTFRKAKNFFDVVTYTGDGVAGREIPHNLGVAPGTIFIKRLDTSNDWIVYHRSTGNSAYLRLNKTNAVSSSTDIWGATGPTSSKFTLGSGGSTSNAADGTYVAYLFAHDDSDESIIKCGSFTGNPTTIDLGFEPQWMIAKKYDSTSSWQMFDSMRGWTADGGTVDLAANGSDSETDRTSQNYTQLKSDGVTFNGYGGSWIYMAIRRPNKPAVKFKPNELFDIYYNGSGTTDPVHRTSPEFPVDMSLFRGDVTTTQNMNAASRLTGPQYVKTNLTDAEDSLGSDGKWDYMNGWRATGGRSQHSWMWRRAPGFMDVVAYAGNGQMGHAVPHNLGVAPEMLWVKRRDVTDNWPVWHKSIANTDSLFLNFPDPKNINLATYWNSTTPTDTEFSLGNANAVNGAGATYIAYLFASVPGRSKVGSYVGTGSPQTIDCGFSKGARFVLIKQIDGGGGDWRFFDAVRGIVSGNDQMLALNSNLQQTAYNDYLTPDDSGFALSGNPANAPGDTFLFYAIAHSDTSRASDTAKAIKGAVQKKVRDTVKQKAKEVVVEKVDQAREVVAERVDQAKEAIVDKVKNSKDIKDDS